MRGNGSEPTDGVRDEQRKVPDLERARQGAGYADRWLDQQRQRNDLPGLVAAIRLGDETLLLDGYGLADVERGVPMTPDHIFRVASHSKTFTATAIMQLKERGRLRLDDAIVEYVPWVPGRLGAATLRQLLNHSSGIVRDGRNADYWQLDHPFPDAAELRRLVDEGGEILQIDEAFKYSNIGYSLLGLAVEAASAMKYHEYVRRHIVDRLGLRDTGPETSASARQRLVTGYTPRILGMPRRPVPDVETGAMAAATGFYSTAGDLCRYAAAHCHGNEELLGDAPKREVQQPYWATERDGEWYGLGFGVADIGKRRVVGHSGGFPGHSTRTWFDPRDRLVVVVLTNATDGAASALAKGIIQIIDFALESDGDTGGKSGPDLERFTGQFVNWWGVTDVVRFGNRLVAVSPDDAQPMDKPVELGVVDADTLRIHAADGYGFRGETMRYERDASGRVIRLVFGGMSSYPPEIFRDRPGLSG